MVNQLNGTEIAIIGMAGRFPRSKNIEEFWRNLRDGVECIMFFTAEEVLRNGVDESVLRDANFVKAASLIDDMEMFDASFFSYSPREAELIDPQQRIFLESAYEALEAAGYNPWTYPGSIGVYAGTAINTYLLFNTLRNQEILDSFDQLQINIANDKDFLTTRVSYKLNLKGPSHLVQSACSTSLVAVHVACQSLLGGECDMALAGGVSINVNRRNGYRYLDRGMVSPDGHCRAFDARAQGTIFGSGVGLVVLKRLEDALNDGDSIHAIIRGSAINNDGSLKVGYTAPSVDGQAEVITEALSNAGVTADTISYIETHGTGTPLGDPIEIQALTKAYRTCTEKRGYCAIGSVKTNVGHLDAAAGIAGLIKTVQALKHRQLPASLHFEQPNPEIDFANSPFYVNSRLREWSSDGSRLRAGVSSFGVGGTNAHVIVEEAPEREASGAGREYQLIVLSARSETALETASRNLGRHLSERVEENLADVAYTLQVGRRRMNYRRAVVCREVEEAVRLLESNEGQRVYRAELEGETPRLVFMFPGQGSQYVNMGRGLYEKEEEFGKQVGWCSEVLRERVGIDVRRVLYPPAGKEREAEEELNETRMTQPALFIVEYAMAKQLESWGIKPDAMIGHSLGEYVAGCLAGVMSIEDALWLVSRRGEMMEEVRRGGMVAVMMSEAEAEERIKGKEMSIAAVNGRRQIVISGEEGAVEELMEELRKEGKVSRRLKTRQAFHSRMMEDVAERYVEEVRKVGLRRGEVEYISNVSGRIAREEEMKDARYWGRQMRERVRFGDGIEELTRRGGVILLEVGPGESLSRLARQSVEGRGKEVIISTMRRAEERGKDGEYLTKALGELWLAGVEIDWKSYHEGEKRRRVGLPTYPFERQRYWIEARGGAGESEGSGESGLGSDVKKAGVETVADAGIRSASLHARPILPNAYVAPANDREKTIAAIWQVALGVDKVGVDDNFFELGGDSLIAIQVISQLKEEFKIDIPVAGLYERLTIRSIDALISSSLGEGVLSNESGPNSTSRSDRVLQRKRFQEEQRLKRSGG
jgi:phthiocerol/phenolphthiocerol synthesis type-I polyketide synthase E